MTDARDIHGICCDCKEHTTLSECCCTGQVYSEGSIYDADDFCAECFLDECVCAATAKELAMIKACAKFDRERDEKKDAKATGDRP